MFVLFCPEQSFDAHNGFSITLSHGQMRVSILYISFVGNFSISDMFLSNAGKTIKTIWWSRIQTMTIYLLI